MCKMVTGKLLIFQKSTVAVSLRMETAVKVFYVCLPVVALLLCSCESNRFFKYEIFEIEGLEGKACTATSINKKGEIVGEVYEKSGNRAFFWGLNEGLVYFKCPSFTKTKIITINDNSLVLGYGLNANGDYRSFVWNPKEGFRYPENNKGILDLKDLNNKNGAVGTISIDGEVFCCFWDIDNEGYDIFRNPIEPASVNDHFEVVGSMFYDSEWRACYLGVDRDTSLVVALELGVWSKLKDINNHSEAVGWIERDSSPRAFIWHSKRGVVYLDAIDDMSTILWGSKMKAYSINNVGQVVGWSSKGVVGPLLFYDDGRAFYWDSEDGVQELYSKIKNKKQWTNLVEAYDINDNGIIVGWGFNKKYADNRRAFYLKPFVKP